MLRKDDDRTIGQIADHFPMIRAAIKKHLDILQKGGLISVTAKGRERLNHLEPEALTQITEWIASFDPPAEDHLSALKRSIAREWGN